MKDAEKLVKEFAEKLSEKFVRIQNSVLNLKSEIENTWDESATPINEIGKDIEGYVANNRELTSLELGLKCSRS